MPWRKLLVGERAEVPGSAGRRTWSVLRRGVSRSRGRGAIPQEVCVVGLQCVRVARRTGEDRTAHQSDGHRQMSTGHEQWAKDDATETRNWRAVQGSWHSVHRGPSCKTSMDLPDLQFSSKTVGQIAMPVVKTEARLRKISLVFGSGCWTTYFHGYWSEMTECVAFGDTDWAEH